MFALYPCGAATRPTQAGSLSSAGLLRDADHHLPILPPRSIEMNASGVRSRLPDRLADFDPSVGDGEATSRWNFQRVGFVLTMKPRGQPLATIWNRLRGAAARWSRCNPRSPADRRPREVVGAGDCRLKWSPPTLSSTSMPSGAAMASCSRTAAR